MKTFKLTSALAAAFVLAACASTYTVPVDLTPEDLAVKQKQAQALTELIDANRDAGQIDPFDEIDLARLYEDMGQLGKAIGVYLEYLRTGEKARAVYHNLGRLYEQVGDYKKAAKNYQVLAEEYRESDYLKDMTWAYVRGKDYEEAKTTYGAWATATQQNDVQLQLAIAALKK